MVEHAEKHGVHSLGEADLVALPRLHRAAVSALSVARAISLDRNVLDYLEGLTARSHFCVYVGRRDAGRAFLEFWAQGFPRAVRGAAPQFALAAALLGAGVLTAFVLVLGDLDLYHAFVPSALAQGRDPDASVAELRAVLYDENADLLSALTLFASFLFHHNTQIGILCFALGFAAGVPVLYLLFQNGLMLGAMAALHHARGLSVDFWGWILPHGVPELLAVVLCGAAGLLQGTAVLRPGRRTRAAALREAGRHAGVIVLGAVGLFLLAAVLEGFFRQLVHSVPTRYAVALTGAAAALLYFRTAGRTQR